MRTDDEREALWAERDRRREETEAHYAVQGEKHRQERAKIMADAMEETSERELGACSWLDLALAAHDALTADGTVFASLTPCDHPGWTE